MTQDFLWVYAFNLIVNGFLSFLTAAILFQIVIWVLRVKHPRLAALLLCLPLLKTGVDPFLYHFDTWAYGHHINPWEAAEGSRMLTAGFGYDPVTLTPFSSMIQFSVNQVFTFSVADLLVLSLSFFWIKSIVTIVLTGSVLFLMSFMMRLKKALKEVSQITMHSHLCDRPLVTDRLASKIEKYKIRLAVSWDITVPCAFGVRQKWIIFPKALIETLSQEEFEVIIAHELDHLRWYDGAVRLVCEVFRSVFWWIPMGWWVRRVEQTQEIACDTIVSAYNLSQEDLASALVKTVKSASTPMLVTQFAHDNSLKARMCALQETYRGYWLQKVLALVLGVLLFFGRFWIF